MARVTSVAICAITFRRPVGLDRLLSHLAQLTPWSPPSGEAPASVRVVIVENEPNGPGLEVCRNWQGRFPFPLEHAVESQRGIPFARNKAIECAGEADFVAFLDDDEWPESHWLAELLNWQAKTKSDIVAGPVLPHYEDGISPWVIRGRFHERRRRPSGTVLVPMGAGNVLIAQHVFQKLEPAFAARFALSGGEDSNFFQRAARAGLSAIWCDEAVVHESVPRSRATAGWICRRAYRSGANFASTQFEVQPWLRACRNVSWRIAKHLGWGIVGLPLSVCKGKAGIVSQLSHISRAGGIVAGLFGHQYAEYQTIHGN